MLLLSPPSAAQIQQFLARASEVEYSYPEVGASAGTIPRRYVVDHNRVRLGRGKQDWNKAVTALRGWKMFDLDRLSLYWPSTAMRAGENVAVVMHYWNCYWLNACRIVYVIDDKGPLERFGFAYGTLRDHAESGEERFSVEWNRETDEVSYDLLAFSRPNYLLVRLGYPFARRLQRRFAADSGQAMLKAIAASATAQSPSS